MFRPCPGTGSFDSISSDPAAQGTALGGASVANGYLTLDGTNGDAQFGTHLVPTSGDFTVSMFVRPAAKQTTFVEFISQGVSGAGFYLGYNPSGNFCATDFRPTTIPVRFQNDWVYLSLVRSGTTLQFLTIDGFGGVGALATVAGTLGLGGNDTRLGRQFDPFTEFFQGDIDEVRIYGNALNNAQLQALSTQREASFTAPEPASFALVGAGLALVGFTARRKRRS